MRGSKTAVARTAIQVLVIGCFMTCSGDPSGGQERDGRTRYEYKEDLTRIVGLLRGGVVFRGHLDARGNFVPIAGEKPIDPSRPGAAGISFPIINTPRTEPKFEFRNGSYVAVTPPEPVFEFRSGRIYSGKLDDKGNFIPDVWARCYDFKGYRFRKTVRIYNLPGTFVEKKS